MSNTSDQTTQQNKKTRLIIDEVGVDTETGIIGRGHSYDNGKTFTVDKTIYGRIFHENDYDQVWKGIQDKVTTIVEPAKSAADSAVAYANDAIEKSKVNSQAIDDINSAVSDAASDAAVARSDGLRAWNAAQSNVNLIDLNYASASAAISSARTEAIAAADEAKSSASAAQADVVAVKSSVAAVQADVTATRSDVAVAKSDIADTKTSLSSQATSLSSYAAQASANGVDIVTIKSQAGQFEQDMASIKGDVSQLKVSASSASVALSDAAGNISSLKATASELETKYADAANDISQIKTDAKGMTQTISTAQGDIANLKTRADGFDAEFATANGNISKLQTDATGTTQTLANTKSDVAVLQSRADGLDTKYANAAGDINTLKANASGISQTLTNSQGDISTLKSTVSGVQTTLTDAQGNISTLQSDVSGLKKTTSDNAGNISTLQATAKTLTSQMSGAQGDISTLKQTASDFNSKVSGMATSLSDANSKINGITSNGGGRNLYTDTQNFSNLLSWYASTTSLSNYWTKVTDTYNGLTVMQTTQPWNGLSQYIQVKKGDVLTYSVYAKYTNGTGTSRVCWQLNSQTEGSYSTATVNPTNNIVTITDSWQRVSGTAVATSDGYVRPRIERTDGNTNTLQIAGIKLEKGIVAHDWSPAPEDTDAKITANTTAIEQNKNAITLKADQTNVDTLKGTVNQLQSSLTVQAGQIQEKVTSSQVTGMLASYATQDYTQSLVTQKANDWNLNLTNLKTDVNAIKTNGGGVNLITGTSRDLQTVPDSPNKSNGGLLHVFSSDELSSLSGNQVTTRAFIHNTTTHTVNLVIWTDNGNFGVGTGVPAGTDGYSTITAYNINPKATKGDISVRSYTENTAISGVQYKEFELEKGTVAHDWSPAPSDMATVNSVTNLSATVDGIKSTVATKADQSEVTQLSNLVQSKVSSGDFTSTTTQLKNLINQRVQVGDVISQINQEAGGDTLIQVSNGKKSLILDAENTIITGEAWIPGAAIGSLDASKLTFYGANNTYATIGASVAQYDDDNQKSTINLQYNGGIEIHSSNQQGSILTMHDNTIRLASKSWGDNPNAYQYSGFYAAPNYSLMNTYHRDGTTSGVAIDDNQIHIYGSSKDQQLGALKADVGWYSINGKTGSLTGDQISLKAGNTQAVLTDNNIKINNASDTNDKNYDVAIHIKGWAEMTGWFTCMGITQTSLLSTKTRIEPLDTKVALDKITSTNVETYQFKSDVAQGKTKRHASVIIDDVHDVAEYYTPEEFISENRMGRDDGDIIGYLMGAVQELKKQLDELKEKI